MSYAAKIPRYFTATIPAGLSRSVDAPFERWFIISATGPLGIKTNLSSKRTFVARTGEDAPPGVIYERIEIFNDTVADIDLEIFYGAGNFVDNRAEDAGSVEVTSSALPAGASTAAKQDTCNASLASIDAKLTAPLAVSGPLTDAELRATSIPVTRTKVGAQGNAWNAAAVLAAGVSASVDAGSLPNVSAFGNVDAATTITVQVSEDNATFYDTTSTVVLAGAGNFHVSLNTGARYVRLKSSGAATITATIAAKG